MSVILHGIGAVLAGFVAMSIVVMIGTAVASQLLIPGGMAAMRSGSPASIPASYLTANLVISLLAAVLGGWLTARLAPMHVHWHVYALAAFLLVMGLVSAKMMSSAQPGWYAKTIPFVGVAGVLLGGFHIPH